MSPPTHTHTKTHTYMHTHLQTFPSSAIRNPSSPLTACFLSFLFPLCYFFPSPFIPWPPDCPSLYLFSSHLLLSFSSLCLLCLPFPFCPPVLFHCFCKHSLVEQTLRPHPALISEQKLKNLLSSTLCSCHSLFMFSLQKRH